MMSMFKAGPANVFMLLDQMWTMILQELHIIIMIIFTIFLFGPIKLCLVMWKVQHAWWNIHCIRVHVLLSEDVLNNKQTSTKHFYDDWPCMLHCYSNTSWYIRIKYWSTPKWIYGEGHSHQQMGSLGFPHYIFFFSI